MTVDEQDLVDDLDLVTRKPDAPLDEISARILGVLEDHHVASSHGSVRQQGRFQSEERLPEDELVDQDVIPDQEILLHRPGGDLEGLHRKGAGEDREYQSDQEHLEVLTQERSRSGHRWMEAQ